jgi:hypothetical protein
MEGLNDPKPEQVKAINSNINFLGGIEDTVGSNEIVLNV